MLICYVGPATGLLYLVLSSGYLPVPLPWPCYRPFPVIGPSLPALHYQPFLLQGLCYRPFPVIGLLLQAEENFIYQSSRIRSFAFYIMWGQHHLSKFTYLIFCLCQYPMRRKESPIVHTSNSRFYCLDPRLACRSHPSRPQYFISERINYQEVYASDSLTWLLRLSTTLQILFFLCLQYCMRERISLIEVHVSESRTLGYFADLISFAFNPSFLPSEFHAGESHLSEIWAFNSSTSSLGLQTTL